MVVNELARIDKSRQGDSTFVNKALVAVFGTAKLKSSSLTGRSGPTLNKDHLMWIKGTYSYTYLIFNSFVFGTRNLPGDRQSLSG